MSLKPYKRFKFNEMKVSFKETNMEDKIKRNMLESNIGSFLNIRLWESNDNVYCESIDNARYFKTTVSRD